MGSGTAQALTESVPLHHLTGGKEEALLLPTIYAQQEVIFTRPKTWNLSPASYVEVHFQHSHELKRSWLQVLVNDKVIHHVALTPQNETGTTLKVPLPVALLQDFNRLDFRVEQHYTDKCEDPTDPSLWTQILPATRLVLDYTPKPTPVELSQFPYPLIDPLTYGPAALQYVLPRRPGVEELKALAILNTHLGKVAQKKKLVTKVSDADAPPDASVNPAFHRVYLGTAADQPALAQFADRFPDYALVGNQWVQRETGQRLGDKDGLIAYFAAGSRGVLLVTGNTPAGVLQAMRFLTNRPLEDKLKGSAVVVSGNWSPDASRQSVHKSRFIERESRTFSELGFTTQAVERMTAPPITYKVPIVGNFHRDGAKLLLDVVYSYGPGTNPRFTSLEWRLNDRPIANIMLPNPNGENIQKATIPIPTDLIQPNNRLVAQFHLMPDKYGWCKDDYIDKAWGKIHDDSKFRVEGPVGLRLPDIGLMNETGYPYTRRHNLENLHIALPDNPSREQIQALLGVTGRLGRATQPDTDLRFTLSVGPQGVPKDRDLILIGEKSLPTDLRSAFLLRWPTTSSRKLKTEDGVGFEAISRPLGAYLESQLLPGQSERVMTLLHGEAGSAYGLLAQLFERDDWFETLPYGRVGQVTPGFQEPNSDPNGHGVLATPLISAGEARAANPWLDWLGLYPWYVWLGIGFVALLFLRLLTRMLFALVRRR